MATFDDLLKRTGGGASSPTGVPNQPKVPGGPPTPSQPPAFVNPASAATAPNGRPPGPPPMPAGGYGSALPIAAGANGGQAQAGQTGGVRQQGRPPLPGQNQPAAPAPPGQADATGAGIQTATTATPLVYALDHVPDAVERANMPPGAQIQTPYGSVDSQGNLIPSPEGAAKYQQAIVSARRSFGPHPWADDPQAPPPPVKLGRKNFNAFTGQWTKASV